MVASLMGSRCVRSSVRRERVAVTDIDVALTRQPPVSITTVTSVMADECGGYSIGAVKGVNTGTVNILVDMMTLEETFTVHRHVEHCQHVLQIKIKTCIIMAGIFLCSIEFEPF